MEVERKKAQRSTRIFDEDLERLTRIKEKTKSHNNATTIKKILDKIEEEVDRMFEL